MPLVEYCLHTTGIYQRNYSTLSWNDKTVLLFQNRPKNGSSARLCRHRGNIGGQVHDLLLNPLAQLELDETTNRDLLSDGGDGLLDGLSRQYQVVQV